MSIASRHKDLVGSNAVDAGSHNLGLVLETVHRAAPISRTELARRTGLSKQAVARIAERLVEQGLVIEARRRRGERGQPAIELEINPDGCYAVGISLDRDHLTILAVDAIGRVRGRIHFEQRYILPASFFALCKDALADFRRRRALNEARLVGIGVAIPDWLGEIPFSGMPAEYAQWTDVDIRSRFARFTDLPVYVDNDATSAALGELTYGLGREFRTFFYIAIGAGMGGGLVIDGVCHHGTSGLSGEIGWLPTPLPDAPEGERRQPLGQLASLFILYDRLRQHGIEVSEPHHLLDLDQRGRSLVAAWLREAARHIAEAAVDIGLMVDPDAILIGGRLPVRLLDDLLRAVQAWLAQDPRAAPPIHRAAGSDDAGALGASTMPLAEVLSLNAGLSPQRSRLPLRHRLTSAGEVVETAPRAGRGSGRTA